MNIKPGKFKAGLSLHKVTGHGLQELLITHWYPAAAAQQSPLTVKDYFLMDRPEQNQYLDSIVTNIICGSGCIINAVTLRNLLNTQTASFKNAAAVNKKFPVILWSSRHGTVYYQFAMNEYLASQGFNVFCISRLTPALPLPWEVDTTRRPWLLQQHLSDMNSLIDFIKKQPRADTSKMALFSWSYGAEAAVFTQQAYPEIDMVFGFSSINFKKPYFIQHHFDSMLVPERLAVPYHLFYEDTSRFGEKFTAAVLHPAHRAISRLIQFPAMLHGNFNYAEGYLPALLITSRTQPWVNGGKPAAAGYETVCRLTLAMLRLQLEKNNPEKLNRQIRKIQKQSSAAFLQTLK